MSLYNVNKVAVLGTGVMGSQIAAHLSNANIKVYAFDINQEVAVNGIENSKKLKPSPYYNFKSIDLIKPMNYEDNLNELKDCDWIIEAISERLDWKQDLYKKIIPYVKENTIVTSNTSGLSLSDLSKGLPTQFLEKFFITHFFNPPRYMKLVEIIKSDVTKNKMVDFIHRYLEDVLGKGVVVAKDTPNFIANRIGTYGMMVTLHESKKRNLSIEDVDALTGTIIGRAKSATFRTADIVGLDTLCYVANTAYSKCVNDSERDVFKLPDYINKMVEKNWLGQKSKQGFYKKVDKGVIYSLDLETFEYTPMKKKRYSAIALAKEKILLSDRLKAIVNSDDLAGEFLWKTFSRTLMYAANLIGEISDDIYSIDRAMKWGFGWELGPFEVLDSIGLKYFIDRCLSDGMKIPDWLLSLQNTKMKTIYITNSGKKYCYDVSLEDYKKIETNPKDIDFSLVKSKNNVIKKHWSASLIDLDDGVAGIELHSVLKPELNPIDGSMMETLAYGLNWVKDNNYKGLVISGDGNNFCAGANLNLILEASLRKDYGGIEKLTQGLQQVFQAVKYSNFPVVAAPYGLVLGGGMEMIGGCDIRVVAAESYIGLVEVGVGLIPGAGGNLRLLSNLSKKMKTGITGSLPLVQKAFETIGFAKVATSANQAKSYGYLIPDDKIVINRSYILNEAKNTVIELSKEYKSPEPETFKLPGSAGRMAVEISVKGFLKAGKISEHDAHIAKKLAYVLTGGSKAGPFTNVDEQYLLDIEREVFVSLCGEQKSLERIKYMLSKGKPLRN